MKVLILSHLYPRPADPGQAPFIRRQVQELRARGVEISVLSPTPWAPPLPGWSLRLRRALAQSRRTPRVWVVDGLQVGAPRYLKLPGALDAGSFGPLYLRGVRRAVRRIHRDEGFDIIHAQMLLPDGYAAARLGRELGVASVVTERGYLSALARRPALHASIRRVLAESDQCVFVAAALAALAASVGTARRAPRVVYTGVDAERFAGGDRLAARARLGLPRDATIVLHLGRNDPRKGVAELLEAFAGVATSGAVLAFVGTGESDGRLRERAAALGCAGRVVVAGQRDHAEVPAWIAACDVVAHPSRRLAEGLPNALVEAGAAARPAVASRVSGIPEVVVDGETGILVEPEDTAGLRAALARLIGDRRLREAMGAAARQFVLARFSWKRHGDEMLDVYRSVVDAGKTAA